MMPRARHFAAVNRLMQDVDDMACLTIKPVDGLLSGQPAELLPAILKAEKAANLVTVSIDGIRVCFDTPADHFEGIYPDHRTDSWMVKMQLDENDFYLLDKTRTLRAAAQVFTEAEDFYEEFGIDSISLEPEEDRALPSQEALRRLLAYDADTKVLTWRRRFPYAGDKNVRKITAFNSKYAGQPAMITPRAEQGLYGVIEGKTYSRAKVLYKLLTGREVAKGASPTDRQHFKGFVHDYGIA